MMPIQPINGTLITLRPVTKDDAPSIHHFARDKDISRFTFMPHPYTRTDADDWVRLATEQNRTGEQLNMGIEDKKSGEIVGMISLMRINLIHRRGELGYWVGKPYWGRGYMTEAIQLMVDYAFRRLRLNRVFARVFHPNTASARVLEKNGFVLEGTQRKHVKRYSRYLDERMYGLLREDWRSHKLRQ